MVIRLTSLWKHRSDRRQKPALLAVILPEPLASEVLELLRIGKRVEAVKLTRARTGLGLLPAVKAVDALACD
ncbi:hypothetical protein CLV35_2630 [Motilibacter peucedani]|uniref:Uncharacterized protein n=1 Tax=Motilibacter peucedani TaxID=598650 RepID=A0A420XPK4_9ACTN|nr:hypothetical protein [Motilibacter peucedani]RKS74129.1 hypothetical protein CLV35_2630 [Motilibacter peucedani]